MIEHCIENPGAPTLPGVYRPVIYEWDITGVVGKPIDAMTMGDVKRAAVRRSAEGQTVTLDIESVYPINPGRMSMVSVARNIEKRRAIIDAVREVRPCDGWYGLPYVLDNWYSFSADMRARRASMEAIKSLDPEWSVFGRRVHLSLYREFASHESWLQITRTAIREADNRPLPITAWVSPIEGHGSAQRVMTGEEFAADCRHILGLLRPDQGDTLRVWFPRTATWDSAWTWHEGIPTSSAIGDER